ncbi:hypothetical protein Hanom_Chr01g00044871 [Helianthus anomalus]
MGSSSCFYTGIQPSTCFRRFIWSSFACVQLARGRTCFRRFILSSFRYFYVYICIHH